MKEPAVETTEEEDTSCGSEKKLPQKGKVSRTCEKCSKGNTSCLFSFQKSVCWECFEEGFVHRFKINCIKGRKSKRVVDNLLLGFSGGHSSRAMLELMSLCIGKGNRKKISFNVSVVHIDESSLIPSITVEERKERLKQIQEMYHTQCSYEFPFYILPLEAVFLPEGEKLFNGIANTNTNTNTSTNTNPNPTTTTTTTTTTQQSQSEGKENSDLKTNSSSVKGQVVDFLSPEVQKQTAALQQLFSNTTSLTTKEDLLFVLRSHLLTRLGAELGCIRLVTGETATRLAIKVISDTAKGRGFNLPKEVAYLDTVYRDNDIAVVRPMKDFLIKEVAYYNYRHKLAIFPLISLTTFAPNRSSINHQVQGFISGLESNFPQTVHTILRTADKLITPSPPADAIHLCALCRGLLNNNEFEEVKKASSTPQANQISKESKCHSKQKGEKKEGGCGSCQCVTAEQPQTATTTTTTATTTTTTTTTTSTTSDATSVASHLAGHSGSSYLSSFLCYSCKKMAKESKEDLLPPYVSQNLTQTSSSFHLREKIKDFLLDDDE
eukprot:TRINITY_DN820_c0_g1_i1.p1 TRINITY_DN820_c0_g1~~TRINITY_DN820_c0_g1_i1.p1  ORF type:complete len:560 (+),score=174.93 TRINITY_DN820_c0_g1_i1:33-1682(+)